MVVDDSGRTMSDYLANAPNTAIDYVYFNNEEFEGHFSEDNLYRSLSPALVQTKQSASHLYFVNSIHELNRAFDDVAFCADQLRSTSLVATQQCDELAKNRDNLSEIITFSIIASLTIILFLAVTVVAFVFLKRYLKANEIRAEFIRQIKINDCHQFDHIQTLWKVPENNVEIEYDSLIGKGAQSFVYNGEKKTLCPDNFSFRQIETEITNSHYLH